MCTLAHLHFHKCTRLFLVPLLCITSTHFLLITPSLILRHYFVALPLAFTFISTNTPLATPVSTHLRTSPHLAFHLALPLYAPWKQGAVVEILSVAVVWQPFLVVQPASCPCGVLWPEGINRWIKDKQIHIQRRKSSSKHYFQNLKTHTEELSLKIPLTYYSNAQKRTKVIIFVFFRLLIHPFIFQVTFSISQHNSKCIFLKFTSPKMSDRDYAVFYLKKFVTRKVISHSSPERGDACALMPVSYKYEIQM